MREARDLFEDELTDDLERIHGQVRSQNRITDREESLWATHSGYWFAKLREEEKDKLNAHFLM